MLRREGFKSVGDAKLKVARRGRVNFRGGEFKLRRCKDSLSMTGRSRPINSRVEECSNCRTTGSRIRHPGSMSWGKWTFRLRYWIFLAHKVSGRVVIRWSTSAAWNKFYPFATILQFSTRVASQYGRRNWRNRVVTGQIWSRKGVLWELPMKWMVRGNSRLNREYLDVQCDWGGIFSLLEKNKLKDNEILSKGR